MEQKLTLVVGLGEIGRPLFEVITEGGCKTRGIDIDPVEVSEAIGLMHICIPFDVPEGFVSTVLAYAKKHQPEVIVINSTVRPGTTRSISKESGLPAVYSPVRGKHTRMAQELKHYTKFVAGVEPPSTERVKQHFSDVGMKSRVLLAPETLELAKLCETTYFGILIAWAQEMDRMAREVGGDYMEATAFFEEVSYLPQHVFLPGFIGGHCVIPNIGILKSQFESGLLDGVLQSNEKKALELGGPTEVKNRQRLEPVKIGDKTAS